MKDIYSLRTCKAHKRNVVRSIDLKGANKYIGD